MNSLRVSIYHLCPNSDFLIFLILSCLSSVTIICGRNLYGCFTQRSAGNLIFSQRFQWCYVLLYITDSSAAITFWQQQILNQYIQYICINFQHNNIESCGQILPIFCLFVIRLCDHIHYNSTLILISPYYIYMVTKMIVTSTENEFTLFLMFVCFVLNFKLTSMYIMLMTCIKFGSNNKECLQNFYQRNDILFFEMQSHNFQSYQFQCVPFIIQGSFCISTSAVKKNKKTKLLSLHVHYLTI